MPRTATSTRKKATTKTTKTTTSKKTIGRPKAKAPAKKSTSTTRKYSPLAQEEVKKEMKKYNKGTARSGKSGAPVTSRAQAIAIGLSEARKKGAKVPKKKS